MVLLKGGSRSLPRCGPARPTSPTAAFTGQTNVGHWVRERRWRQAVPGLLGAARRPTPAARRATPRRRANAEQDARGRRSRPGRRPDRHGPRSRKGVTPIFSPRSGSEVLDMYADMVDDGRRRLLHHARLRHQQGLQGAAEGQHVRQPHRLHAAREGGRAEPRSAKDRSCGSTPANNVYAGLGLLHQRSGLPMGARRPTRASCSSTSTSATSTRSSC